MFGCLEQQAGSLCREKGGKERADTSDTLGAEPGSLLSKSLRLDRAPARGGSCYRCNQ